MLDSTCKALKEHLTTKKLYARFGPRLNDSSYKWRCYEGTALAYAGLAFPVTHVQVPVYDIEDQSIMTRKFDNHPDGMFPFITTENYAKDGGLEAV